MRHRLREELGLAIMFITHDLALAKYFSWEGRLAVMYLGRIVEVGCTQDIIQNPAHPYTRALLSAVPKADPDITQRKQPMRLRSESIPSLNNIPPGCAFHPRCPFYVPGMCDTTIPPLSDVPQYGQQIACEPIRLEGELTRYEA